MGLCMYYVIQPKGVVIWLIYGKILKLMIIGGEGGK